MAVLHAAWNVLNPCGMFGRDGISMTVPAETAPATRGMSILSGRTESRAPVSGHPARSLGYVAADRPSSGFSCSQRMAAWTRGFWSVVRGMSSLV